VSTVIKVQNVSKDFKLSQQKADSLKSRFTGFYKKNTKIKSQTQHALSCINLNIKEGEFFGIVGRNGSGKSTLLKILAGIYQPTKGEISTSGRLVPFIELGVGFDPELTGRENVYLNGALLGFSKEKIDRIYKDIVSFAELEKFMDQKLKNYSSGMQVRLAFSVATRVDADILIIDEVLAVGDADFQRKCFEYFKSIKNQKKTVVFVSHDMSAVREYCDRAVLIEKSKIIAEGKPSDIADEYNKLFIEQEGASKAHQPGVHWGTGQLATQSVDVEVGANTIKIRQFITAKVDTNNPIVGFRVCDIEGNELLGTNTYVEGIKVGVISSSAGRSFCWEFPNILSDGTYRVDPAVLLDDGVTVCDWWDDSARFKVVKSRHLPYALDPGFIFTARED
jgi:ABC-2 type transport system ATP-binding protein